jgi:hypothetical protein
MSANMDKGLYAAPQGLGSLDEESLDIEIVSPDEADDIMDGEDIELATSKEDHNANIAEDMDERELQSLSSELLGDYEADVMARKDWLTAYVDGLKLLGLKNEDRTEPWPGACGVTHPLLMESAVKFQSETIMETFPAAGPVRTKILGKETAEKKEAATRVEEDMNYELTEVMSIARSMSACSSACVWLATRSRRFTSTLRWIVRPRRLFPLKIWSCPMVPPVWSRLSASRTGCGRPRTT